MAEGVLYMDGVGSLEVDISGDGKYISKNQQHKQQQRYSHYYPCY